MAQDIIKRFKQLSNYNVKKGIINEGLDDVDASKYICIGEVQNFFPWFDDTGKNKVYIMASPEKIMKYGEMMYDIVYTENNDGTGRQTDSVPTYYKLRNAKIYPEHYDDEYGEMFLGKKKDENTIKEKHNAFMSNLFKIGNKVVIHHSSSYKITDGVIKKGTPNRWSNNSDIGIYFWGSRTSGNDVSGYSKYIYYCLINEHDLYDFETNEERFISLSEAMTKYKYAGQYWLKSNNIVVTTYFQTPIWCVLDKQTGIWYDKDWREIQKPF